MATLSHGRYSKASLEHDRHERFNRLMNRYEHELDRSNSIGWIIGLIFVFAMVLYAVGVGADRLGSINSRTQTDDSLKTITSYPVVPGTQSLVYAADIKKPPR